ncbi:HAMP domain-containing histidine kinase [Desulfovibrio sp. OttesenSCG-928-O18]|nr:HAMP domain-containing histidine kinase [Desulfovibrio sp. OttesenSCG-928-O18]
MRLFTRLWQRVFVYALILILAASAMGMLLLDRNLTDKASAVVLAFTSEIRKALDGQTPEEADRFLARLNNQEAKFWLENEHGILLAGRRFAERSGAEWREFLHDEHVSGAVTLWRTRLKTPMFMAIAPCALKGEKATLYAAYMAYPIPPLETLLSPGIITVALITGLLALWMAMKVGRPLRHLQEEVAHITGTLRLRNVSVTGSDEIADVARAVNRLVEGLRRHITGMNQLVMNISHEMRSPLARMAIAAEVIGEGLAVCRRRGAGDCERDEAVLRLAEKNFEALRQELEHMDNLIGGTLLSSKLDVQDPGGLTESVSLSALCASAVERYEETFRHAGIRFSHTIADNITATGDGTLLMQLLSNLLDNAVKYASGSEPGVQLQLWREAEEAVLTVENTHADPLPKEAIEHLFEPYFRYEQRAGTGVGLGLPIVQKIATLHGGTIRVENTATGILFRLCLPFVI